MLTQFKSGQLQQVVDIIIKAIVPERIFLLGVTEVRQFEYNIFNRRADTSAITHIANYSLLVLIRSDDNRPHEEILDIIEGRCKCAATPVTVFIEPLHVFNEWLAAGNYFAWNVHVRGVLLYTTTSVQESNAAVFIEKPNVQQLAVNLDKEFLKSNSLITEFLAGTELYRLRKQFTLAAFLLHQAAEQALTIIIRVVTGYRAVTHNLDKLLRYARPSSDKLGLLYLHVTSNEKENKIFRLLQQAYVHSRYREEYTIKENELNILYGQVLQLQKIVVELARQSIKNMEEKLPG